MSFIKAKRIEAENIAEVQLFGTDAETAASLVALAREIQHGTIEADVIQAKNIGVIQHFADPEQPTLDELRRAMEELRAELAAAIEAGVVESAGDAEDLRSGADTAAAELAKPEPDGSRVTRRLGEVAEILTKGAEAAQAAGKVGVELAKLAPAAMMLWKLAQAYFGG